MEELKTSPGGEEATTNAPALAAKALDLELNGPSLKAEDPSKPVVINDLSTMVRKKKRPAPSDTEANGKRKAEDEVPAAEAPLGRSQFWKIRLLLSACGLHKQSECRLWLRQLHRSNVYRRLH